MTPKVFRQWRTIHHLTQADVASMFGLQRRTVARYEAGIEAIPGFVAQRVQLWIYRAQETAPNMDKYEKPPSHAFSLSETLTAHSSWKAVSAPGKVVTRCILLGRLRELVVSTDAQAARLEADTLLLRYLHDEEIQEAYDAVTAHCGTDAVMGKGAVVIGEHSFEVHFVSAAPGGGRLVPAQPQTWSEASMRKEVIDCGYMQAKRT